MSEQDRLPRRRRRRPLPHYDVVAAIVRKGGRVLIDRRKDEGLLGGRWEFPGGKVRKGESMEAAVRREVREELGIGIGGLRPFVTVRHAYSHFRITLNTFLCRHVSGRAQAIQCEAWKWVRLTDLGQYAFPRANGRIIEALMAARSRPPRQQRK